MPDIYILHRLTLRSPGSQLFAALSEAVPGLSRSQARQAVIAGLAKVDGNVTRDTKLLLTAKPMRCDLDLRHGIKAALKVQRFGGVAAVNRTDPFTVLHEDAHLLVVDKAAGILSSPPRKEPGEKLVRGHLPELLRRMFRKQGREVHYIGVVHRLDMDTSGCICFALNREAHRLLGAQFAGEAAGRTYRTWVVGGPRADSDTITGFMARGEGGKRRLTRTAADANEEEREGKEAITHFKVVKRLAKGSDLEVDLETGRTHQIRVCMSAIGCPVFGDRVYGFHPRPGEPSPPPAPRLMLHAWKLSLDHPATGKRMVFEAPMPKEFTEFAKLLK